MTSQKSVNLRFRSNRFAEIQYLPQLRRAIIEQRMVRLHYRKRFEESQPNDHSQREVEPFAVKRHGEAWYLIALCHLSGHIRTFRLSRIQHLTLLTKTFKRPADFKSTLRTVSLESRELVIRVLFGRQAADWLQEARSFYIVDEVPHEQGLLVTLNVRHERDVLPWLLIWGSHIQVLEPGSLRQKLVEEAQKIQRQHQD
jgi:predicted DNA-binding transcriptional regulator YafY